MIAEAGGSTVGEMLLKHGISRRGFIQYCTAVASARRAGAPAVHLRRGQDLGGGVEVGGGRGGDGRTTEGDAGRQDERKSDEEGRASPDHARILPRAWRCAASGEGAS